MLCHFNCRTRVLTFLILVWSWFSLCSLTALAFTLGPDELDTYLKMSLGNSTNTVRKPTATAPFSYAVSCKGVQASRCNRSLLNDRFQHPLGGNYRFRLGEVSVNPLIRFYFADEVEARRIRATLSEIYRNDFIDSDDKDCQLYYRKRDDVISGVAIVLSLDSAVIKQNICLSSQLFQSLGLSLPRNKSFSQLWKSPPEGRVSFTTSDVSEIAESYGIISFIHLCDEIKPAMTELEVRELLSTHSKCLEGLFEK